MLIKSGSAPIILHSNLYFRSNAPLCKRRTFSYDGDGHRGAHNPYFLSWFIILGIARASRKRYRNFEGKKKH